MMTVMAIIAGFILDLIFGDPKWLPHPICLIGNTISFFEKILRRLFGSSNSLLLLGGGILVIIVASLSFGLPYLILHWAHSINPLLKLLLETFMFYQIFATKCLQEESMKVYKKLVEGDIVGARKQLSWIVGRDTQELTPDEVAKGAIETVAENATDGIVAPMFYMFLGGAPLAFLYKAINTMDSMVGYKNEKYLYFGRCAARLDDVFNYVPARLTALLMIIASYFLDYDYRKAKSIFWRDRYNHLSPNSAQTESVCAGALNIQLGGGHFYFGKFVPKATIGDALREVSPDDIKKANNLMYLTTILAVTVFSLFKLLIIFLRNGNYV